MINLVIPVFLTAGFLISIRLMQSPRTALWGNRLGALSMALAILFAFQQLGVTENLQAFIYIVLGAGVGIFLGQQVRMIQMPQTVALFNGLGGGASALVAGTAVGISTGAEPWVFWLTAALALGIGTLTLSGSVVAALKLQGLISQKSVVVKGHGLILLLLLLAGVVSIISLIIIQEFRYQFIIAGLFALYGIFVAVRIGGADMPVVISLLNSFSGIAAAVSGLAVNNILLAGVGSLVGVAGLILTRLMCKAMNRSLYAVLSGFVVPSTSRGTDETETVKGEMLSQEEQIPHLLKKAKKVVIVPGYGMAVAQAQQHVKDLQQALEKAGKVVKFGIHPVAGRMPGHMNVLLAEVGVDYEKLIDMDAINLEFPETDVVIVVGASDIVNPAATSAEGTPIYGMPILKITEAKNIVLCNTGRKSAYSGVENALYQENHVITFLGNAAETIPKLTAEFLKISNGID